MDPDSIVTLVLDDFGTSLTPPPLLSHLDAKVVSTLQHGTRLLRHGLVIQTKFPESSTPGRFSTTAMTLTGQSDPSLHSPGSDSSDIFVELAQSSTSRGSTAGRRLTLTRPSLSADMRATAVRIHTECKNPLLQCQYGIEYTPDRVPNFTAAGMISH